VYWIRLEIEDDFIYSNVMSKRSVYNGCTVGIPRSEMPRDLAKITGCVTVGPILLPPGKYYIGELYPMMITQDKIDLSKIRAKNPSRQGLFKLQSGRSIVMFDTLGTNGMHADESGHEYRLFYGAIAITLSHGIDVESYDWDMRDSSNDLITEKLGRIVEYNHPFKCTSYEFDVDEKQKKTKVCDVEEIRKKTKVQILQFGKKVLFNSTSKKNKCGEWSIPENETDNVEHHEKKREQRAELRRQLYPDRSDNSESSEDYDSDDPCFPDYELVFCSPN